MTGKNEQQAQVARPTLPGRVVSPGTPRGDDESELERRLALFEIEQPRRRLKDLILPAQTTPSTSAVP